MKNFIAKMLLMEKAGDPPAGEGAPKPGEQQPSKKDDPPAQPGGDKKFDEFGYEVVPAEKDPKEAGAPPKEGDPKKEDPSKDTKKVEPGTGYGEDDPVIEDPKPPEAPKDPPPPPTELDKKLEGLNPYMLERAKKQIPEMGLEGDKLDKFVAFLKQEQKQTEDYVKNEAAEALRLDQLRRSQWAKELKQDPVFGGDNFKVNLGRVEKVLDQYGVELKKELTDAKQMLRPSVMRMLARVADQVYPERRMAQGDPPTPIASENDKDKPNDPLAFYQ